MGKELKHSGAALHQVGEFMIASIHNYSDESGIFATGNAILNRLRQDTAKGVVIDLSEVTILSTKEFFILKDMAKAIAVMGTITVLSGFQPGVAASLVDFDTNFDDILTARNTDDALEILANHAMLNRANGTWPKGF
ncbi:hypothetical protein [uncultured Desulfobacter sp.]|uniref:hypothetical protein n=1 Tax=uncultured Desulfobacter sp. TaxID=240139 RepID=UPI002AABA64B|nr:hypothetical protein [uncultured Desulfobacter sp.]